MNLEPIYHYDFDQRDPEWNQIRLGRLTASGGQASQMCVNGEDPSRLGTKALTLAYKKASEILTNSSSESDYVSDAMQRGIDLEPRAIELYEETLPFGSDTRPCGFVSYGKYIGFSPDRIVGEDGLAEVKCPEKPEFVRVLYSFLSGKDYKKYISKDYLNQIQFGLWVTGRAWCDHIYYHPEFESYLSDKIVKIRINRDEKIIEQIQDGADRFVKYVDQIVTTIESNK